MWDSTLILLDVSKLEHAHPITLRGHNSILKPLDHMRVGRKIALAAFAIECSDTLAQQIGVDTCQRVVRCRWIRWVNEPQMQDPTLSVVDVRDELAPGAQGVELFDSFGVVIAF
jgi:hypothetical protein